MRNISISGLVILVALLSPAASAFKSAEDSLGSVNLRIEGPDKVDQERTPCRVVVRNDGEEPVTVAICRRRR